MTKLALFGYGVVGKATHASIVDEFSKNVLIYDPNIEEHSDESVLVRMQQECCIVFICLNIPTSTHDGHQPIGQLKEYLKMFKPTMATKGRAIIRSTISEVTAVKLFLDGLTFFYCPEFLREAHSEYDAVHPTRIVLGSPDNFAYQLAAEEILDLFKNENSAKRFVTSIDEAVSIKLISNYLLAAKTVIVHDLIDKCNGLSKNVVDAVSCDSRIGPYGFDTSSGLGAGGKCFIKDLHLFDICIDDSDIHQAIVKRNYELLLKSGKDKELTDKYHQIYLKGKENV